MSHLREIITRVRLRVARSRQEIIPGSEIGEAIDIGRLICPLRYDLCVRIDFISLLRDQWAQYRTDLNGFLNRPQSRAYYVWFHEVACARFLTQIYHDAKLVQDAFIQRVHATARLWKTVELEGYDRSTPIRLGSGRSIQSVNGKTINSAYFAGDGCHRIACLYLLGQTRLDPKHYEVLVHRKFVPLDNTAILARHIPLDRVTYLHFISRFYCDGQELASTGAILEHVAAGKPDLLPELESVLAFDLPRIPENA